MDDRGLIENLLARYTELLDGAHFDELGALFAGGRVRITGGPHSGRAAAGATEATQLYRDIVLLDPATGATGTRHMVASIRIEVDADRATSTCGFLVLQQTPTLALQVVASGRYEDELARTADGWGFADRHIVCDQTGDLTEHMR